jgi:hypothetical protein
MPTYGFRNKDTGEEETVFMSMAEREAYLAENPHIEQLPSAPAILGRIGLGGRLKPSEGFRDVLRKVKKNNHGSNINTF